MINVPVPRDEAGAGVVMLIDDEAPAEGAFKSCGGLKYDMGDLDDDAALGDGAVPGLSVV